MKNNRTRENDDSFTFRMPRKMRDEVHAAGFNVADYLRRCLELKFAAEKAKIKPKKAG